MPSVELIYDRACPNVPEARANLLRAFTEVGLRPRWSEHVFEDPSAPPAARGFGSPTILVDGREISGAEPAGSGCCRLYDGAGALARAPSAAMIATALAGARDRAPRRGAWRSALSVVPAIGAALLPKVACPACWPAYAGFLSTLGLGFLMETRWLLPLTTVFLALAIGALALRARARQGYRPLGLGLVGAAVVLGGKFGLESDAAMYGGLGLLVIASLWNSWPRKRAPACRACATP